MKILALATIILSLTSGNSNLQVSQKSEKVIENKIKRDTCMQFGFWCLEEPIQESDCQKAKKVMLETISSDDKISKNRFIWAATTYKELDCSKK